VKPPLHLRRWEGDNWQHSFYNTIWHCSFIQRRLLQGTRKVSRVYLLGSGLDSMIIIGLQAAMRAACTAGEAYRRGLLCVQSKIGIPGRLRGCFPAIKKHHSRQIMTTPIHAKPKCARNPCSYFFFILCYRKHKSLFHQTDLVSGTARLGDDALELVDLLLGTAEGTEPLLGELTGTLVLAVTEQLNDTALVGGKAGRSEVSFCSIEIVQLDVLVACVCFGGGIRYQCPWAAGRIPGSPSNSRMRPTRSDSGRGKISTYPATSLTTSRTKAVRLLRWPLVRETRGLETRAVVFYIH
jgi:hypothetical protein